MPSLEYSSRTNEATPNSGHGKKSRKHQLSIYHHHQPFKVAFQKVAIDVDLARCQLLGSTELTIIPTDPANSIIKLDARYLHIRDVFVNDKRVNFLYNDILQLESRRQLSIFEDKELDKEQEAIQDNYSIFHHHLYKQTLKSLFSGTDTKELAIFLPDKMKIGLQEAGLLNALTPIVRDSPGSYKTPSNAELIYTPFNIRIEYECKNPKDGVNFVGGLQNLNQVAKSQWHAYTTNSLVGISTSSWVPCVDNFWEKTTWQIEITVARTIGDIVRNIQETGEKRSDEDDDDLDREIVICCPDLLSMKEYAHSTDPTKKVVSCTVYNPVSPHHIGWAVGPFESISVNGIIEAENEEDGEDDTARVPGFVYYLKDNKELAANTCVVLSRAVEFFSREFGSFPFSSYSVLFAGDTDVDSACFSGFTVHSEKLLYGPEIIDRLFDSTEIIVSALTKQWSGVNVLPRNFEDVWITIGISLYMTSQFIKKLMGYNEFKFRIKKRSEMICDLDIGQPSLADPYINFPVNEAKDFEFIKLKAPIVLFILNRRMTKTDKSFGLLRVIPKLFLQAMSGDLPDGAIDSTHFQHIAEKVNHNKLESFFKQWVYGCGTPIFRITQKFNKKRMFVEMGIRQVQVDEATSLDPKPETVVEDCNKYLNEASSYGVQSVFTGPMTIRIHEADGTPYEHIVNLKDSFTKLDIQYNTKYKRLKRHRKQKEEELEEEKKGTDISLVQEASEYDENGQAYGPTNDSNDVLAHCLGDVLQTDEDVKKWGLFEWSKEQEEKMTHEAFEWIRVDADFEWICKVYINQPDYMFLSQLQQDRDVDAQYESIKYFKESEHRIPVYLTILLRTLMDWRYYHGIRIEAAKALLQYATKEVNFVGMRLLIRAFQTLYCFDTQSNIPLPNDFSDFPLYFIQRIIPVVLSQIKNTQGSSPPRVKVFLLDLLRYNENGQNQFSDCFYVGDLIKSIVSSILETNRDISEEQKAANKAFINKVLLELDRYLRMDEWIPSYHKHVTVVILAEKTKMAIHGLIDLSFEDLLAFTLPEHYDEIRVVAIDGLLRLGGLKNASVLKYIFQMLELDSSHYVKRQIVERLVACVGEAGVHGISSSVDDEEFEPTVEEEEQEQELGADGKRDVIIIEEATNNQFSARKEALDRTTYRGIVKLLRRDFGKGVGLQHEIWRGLHSMLVSVEAKKALFDVASVVFEPSSQMIIRLPVPRDKMLVAKYNGEGKITIFRQSKFKLQFNKKIALKILTKINSDGTGARSPIRSPALRRGLQSPAENVKTPADKIKLDLPVVRPKLAPVKPAPVKPVPVAKVQARTAKSKLSMQKTQVVITTKDKTVLGRFNDRPSYFVKLKVPKRPDFLTEMTNLKRHDSHEYYYGSSTSTSTGQITINFKKKSIVLS